MDDKQRSQGLKAITKVRTAIENAEAELEDILTNGCGAPRQVTAALSRVQKSGVLVKEAHQHIREAHVIAKDETEGASLPFAGGPEATRAPKGKDRKSAAAGDDSKTE